MLGHKLCLTAFDAADRFVAGDTPNQNLGAPGLPQSIRDSLVNRDIVLWLSVGFHQVTQAEDWPVLSHEHLSFQLKPSDFCDRNPALDLRRAPLAGIASQRPPRSSTPTQLPRRTQPPIQPAGPAWARGTAVMAVGD